jgi:2-keto-3-deoxy-L-rhamnonate aldolase RhmA
MVFTQPETGTASQRVLAGLHAGHRLRAAYAGGVVVGTFLIELPTQRAVRALALAGFDFVVLDLEHSPFGLDGLPALVAEAQAVGIPAIVRTPGADPSTIGKILDLGVAGIMVPRVANARQATQVADAARYSPVGSRGLSPLISYQSSPVPQHELGQAPVVIVQLESREALDEVKAIVKVDGLDAVFVGPYDLSQALGRPGDVNSADVIEAAQAIASAASGGPTMLGVYVDNPAWSGAWAQRGFRLQCVGFDGRMLLSAASSVVAEARRVHG